MIIFLGGDFFSLVIYVRTVLHLISEKSISFTIIHALNALFKLFVSLCGFERRKETVAHFTARAQCAAGNRESVGFSSLCSNQSKKEENRV